MKSNATTVAAYLKTLPPDRREAIETVRRAIREHLDRNLRECMQYGVIAYCVPHEGKSGWPHGHHTNPKLPLMYMGLSSQKNDMVVYMLCLYQNEPMRAWFEKAWNAAVENGEAKKLHMEVSGAGCCLRFRKVEDLSLDVIGQTIRRVTVKKYLDNHIAALARMGKGPDGKPIKKAAGARMKKSAAQPRSRPAKAKIAGKGG